MSALFRNSAFECCSDILKSKNLNNTIFFWFCLIKQLFSTLIHPTLVSFDPVWVSSILMGRMENRTSFGPHKNGPKSTSCEHKPSLWQEHALKHEVVLLVFLQKPLAERECITCILRWLLCCDGVQWNTTQDQSTTLIIPSLEAESLGGNWEPFN